MIERNYRAGTETALRMIHSLESLSDIPPSRNDIIMLIKVRQHDGTSIRFGPYLR